MNLLIFDIPYFLSLLFGLWLQTTARSYEVKEALYQKQNALTASWTVIYLFRHRRQRRCWRKAGQTGRKFWDTWKEFSVTLRCEADISGRKFDPFCDFWHILVTLLGVWGSCSAQIHLNCWWSSTFNKNSVDIWRGLL